MAKVYRFEVAVDSINLTKIEQSHYLNAHLFIHCQVHNYQSVLFAENTPWNVNSTILVRKGLRIYLELDVSKLETLRINLLLLFGDNTPLGQAVIELPVKTMDCPSFHGALALQFKTVLFERKGKIITFCALFSSLKW